MWARVLVLLEPAVNLEYVDLESPRRRPWARRPDVWLSDGHLGPLEVAEPSVIQLHEASWQLPETRSHTGPDFIATFEGPSRESATRAAAIITPSESSRAQIIDAYGVAPDVVRSVHHGVDHGVFHPGHRHGQELIGAADAPYVLAVSQVSRRKNLGSLRHAIAGLARRGFPHHLAIVGAPASDHADSTELMAEAAAELPDAPGRVHVVRDLGEEDVAALMAGCAAFCLPSFMEGFGLPVLEAMACGAPVIVSDRGALPEVVGDAGIVVTPEADAIENALATLFETPGLANELSAAATARAQGFSWERTAAGWLEALEQGAAVNA